MHHVAIAHLFTLLLAAINSASGGLFRVANALSDLSLRFRRLRSSVDSLGDRLRERRRRRQAKAIERIPRLWCLVGGTRTIQHPDAYLQKRLGKMWPAVHSHRRYVTQADEGPNCIIRYFIGKRPVAEAVPDPEDGWRIFTK